MSFILDALRKSEHERRMETAPDIMHSPAAVAKPSLPMWAIALMGTLAAALVAVSVFSFSQRFAGTQRIVSAPAPDTVPQRVESVAPPPVETAPSAAIQEQAQQAEPQPATAAPAAAQDVAADAPGNEIEAKPAAAQEIEQSPPASATPPPQPAIAAASQPAVDVSGLASYASAVADGASLPALQMQLHVHSATPSSRFVVVNGSRLREGERTAGGARVEAIVPEGVVLDYQGRRFLLTSN